MAFPGDCTAFCSTLPLHLASVVGGPCVSPKPFSTGREQHASRVRPSIEMSAHAYCLCPRGSNSVRGIARGAKADEVLVTVQNDGVVCYSSARQVSCTKTPSITEPKRSTTCMHCTLLLRLFDSVLASLA